MLVALTERGMPDELPMSSQGATDTVDLFIEDDGTPDIFRKRELLEVSSVPDGDRIVGRDEEIRELVSNLRPVVQDESASPMLIFGKTGTGKSLTARHVGNTAKQVGHENDLAVGVAYVDCAQHNTETQAARATARELNKEVGGPRNVPLTGLSAGQYYTIIWELLEAHFDGAVIILDEIDRIKPTGDGSNRDDILMQFSRAGEAGKTRTSIGVIAISNKIDYAEELNERVKSSFGDQEMQFPPYDADQLLNIMEARKDAFHDGVLEPDVIPKAAALTAKEHGDARKAIRILKNAGLIAEDRGEETVRVEHLDAAKDQAEADRLEEHLSSQTSHARYILLALAALSENEQVIPDNDGYRTTRIHDAYEQVCDLEGMDSLKIDRVRELLAEQAFLDIIESSRVGGGHASGTYTEWRLLKDPSIVRECVDSEYVATGDGHSQSTL